MRNNSARTNPHNSKPRTVKPVLRPNILYEAEVADVAFGAIPHQRLLHILSSGRHCAELLEAEIAERFGIEQGTQGAGADLICPTLGNIQAKSYRSSGLATYQAGPNKGKLKSTVPTIWTTKSGFWDRRNRLTAAQVKEANDYIDEYDYFLYLDISRMLNLSYSFVVVDSATVKSCLTDGFYISESDILSQVKARIVLQ